MRCRSFALAATGLLSVVPAALGARLPRFRRAASDPPPHSTRLSFTNGEDPFHFGVANTQGDGQTIYFVTVNVDGQDFAVNIDTGSADLWLDTTNVTFSNNVHHTNFTGTIGYGDGTVATGEILLAQVKIGDFTIDKQAFISAPGTNATSVGDQGLLGVGPPNLSRIKTELTNSSYSGAPLLQNLFSLYPNESNYMTFMLNRSIFGVTDGGAFTIGEIDPNYTAISNSPHLDVLENSNQWITVMDSVLINGQNFSGHGMLENTTEKVPAQYVGKQVTLLDTGTALAYAPAYFVDALYKDLPNATFIDDAGLYQVPCDTKLNVSMVFSGIEYPVNPLDLTTVGTDSDNVTIICAGTFGYVSPSMSVDWILGDSFLRNVYTLFDYGDYTHTNDTKPYIQLLSTNDKDQAWANFDAANQARIANYKSYVVDNQGTGSPSSTASSIISTPTSTASPISSATVDPDTFKGAALAATDPNAALANYDALMRNSWIIIGLLAAVAVLLLVSIAMQIVRSQQERKYSPLRMGGGGGQGFSSGKGSVYENPYDS